MGFLNIVNIRGRIPEAAAADGMRGSSCPPQRCLDYSTVKMAKWRHLHNDFCPTRAPKRLVSGAAGRFQPLTQHLNVLPGMQDQMCVWVRRTENNNRALF